MSYTDETSWCLLLESIAQYSLAKLLELGQPTFTSQDVRLLRRSFACLATAVEFLHENKVRHKDIKPGNILISNGNFILCDFGISYDWSFKKGDTTESSWFLSTPPYRAPEVNVHKLGSRNSSSDIWSLGRVFFETFFVMQGYSLSDVNDFLREYDDGDDCTSQSMDTWL